MAQDTQQSHHPHPEEESLKELVLRLQDWLKYLWNKKWMILIAMIIGGVLGALSSFLADTTYTASETFVLEESKSVDNRFGGLASLAGISLGSGGGGLFEGENLIDLYKSRRMLSKTLLSPLYPESKDTLLIDTYIELYQDHKDWRKTDFSELDFHKAPDDFARAENAAMAKIVKKIRNENLVVEKKGRQNQIQVQMTSYGEIFSKNFTEVLVQTVSDFYIETRTSKNKKNVDVLERQIDSVRQELNTAIKDVAQSTSINLNPAYQETRIGAAQRQVDVTANEAILKELVKNLELAKISLRKESPFIQVIDAPILPLDKSSVSITKRATIGLILCGLLALGYFVVIKYYRDIMES